MLMHFDFARAKSPPMQASDGNNEDDATVDATFTICQSHVAPWGCPIISIVVNCACADSEFLHSLVYPIEPIDLLIGADLFPSLVQESKLKVESGSPEAIDTTLG
ncbi:hypothetical protein PR048_006983 [Dryococelus australis]|uniref:Uncharacterized protein n=1 Tax=Dryococelus australis TaxID=614101 RepID=A0ABQ9IDN7_9NEOP|nr:hypothetical protein PR048_006983 [Dryococelus australis]